MTSIVKRLEATFDSVITDDAVFDAADAQSMRMRLSDLLGLAEPFVLPPMLSELLAAGVVLCSRSDGEAYAEFGWLGAEMAQVALDYEIPQYMPGAVPLAFDGGGGLYLLDARGGANDGRQPVVWSHAGSLAWMAGEYREVAPDFEALVRDRRAM